MRLGVLLRLEVSVFEAVELVVLQERGLLHHGLVWLSEEVVFLHLVLRHRAHLCQITLQEVAFCGFALRLTRLGRDLLVVYSVQLLRCALLERVRLQTVHVVRVVLLLLSDCPPLNLKARVFAPHVAGPVMFRSLLHIAVDWLALGGWILHEVPAF